MFNIIRVESKTPNLTRMRDGSANVLDNTDSRAVFVTPFESTLVIDADYFSRDYGSRLISAIVSLFSIGAAKTSDEGYFTAQLMKRNVGPEDVYYHLRYRFENEFIRLANQRLKRDAWIFQSEPEEMMLGLKQKTGIGNHLDFAAFPPSNLVIYKDTVIEYLSNKELVIE